MATTKGQKTIEMLKRKVASKLALAEATKSADFDTAVSEYKELGYSTKEAKVAATALQNKYYEEYRKSIIAEAGLAEEDFDVQAEADDDADALDTELEDDDEVTLEDDAPEGEADDMLEDAEDMDVEEEGGFDLDSEEPVLEDENDMPGDGNVVEEIQVPGGVLKVVFEPSEGSDLDEEFGEGEEVGMDDVDGDIDVEGADLDDEVDEFGGEEDVEEVGSRPVPLMRAERGLGGLAMPKDKLAAREAERKRILSAVNAAERKKILAEVLSENEKPKDIGLGDDTARSGDGRGSASVKNFKTENSGDLAVAAPGEEGKSMTMQNSEGNSLKSDPDYLYFDVPTSMPGTVLQQENARGRMKLDGEYGDLAKQSVNFVDAPVPTEGGEDYAEFEVPTQLDTTKQRKVTVASSETEEGQELTLDEVKRDGQLRAAFEFLREKRYASSVFSDNNDERKLRTKVATKDCDAYENNEQEVRIVECEDCNGRFVLSQRAIQDEYCPGCQATIAKAASLVKESCVDKAMWKEEYGEDLCEADGESVTKDPNGDGGFRTQGKEGGAPKDKNARNMGLHEGEYEKVAENEALRKVLADTKYEQTRTAEAYRTAARLAQSGIIEASEIQEQVDQMLSEGMTHEAMRLYGDQASKLAQKTRKAVVAESSVGTRRQASTGLARNFSVAQSDEPVELTTRLANCFSRPNTEDFGDNGRLRK